MHSLAAHFRFRRELLPPAGTFYAREVRKLSRPSSAGWATAVCPFHRDSHPSLRLNFNTGAFRCFPCGASGGGIIDFVMLRDSVDFKTAAKALGAWERTDANERSLRTERARCDQRALWDATVDRLLAAERELRLKVRRQIQDSCQGATLGRFKINRKLVPRR